MDVFEDILGEVLDRFEGMFDELVSVIDIKTVLKESAETQYDILIQLDKAYQHLDKVKDLLRRK